MPYEPWTWITRVVIWRTLILLAALPLLAMSSGCKSDRRPPPMESGECRPAEYTRDLVSAWRCSFDGETWLCSSSENRCKLVFAAKAERPK